MIENHSNNNLKELLKEPSIRGLLSLVLFIGVIAGGAAGAFVASFSGGPVPSGADQELSVNRASTVLVEESSTISTVKAASASVVSIIIERPAGFATGNIRSPFFSLGVPGFDFSPQQSELTPRTDFEEAEEQYVQVGSGTGFVISDTGLILTNRHVISEKDTRISIVTREGDVYEVEVLGVDPVNDLALIKTIEEVNLPAIEIGDSDTIQIGQTVLAIGNSLGEFNNTVTRGVISGVNRRVVASTGRGGVETLESVIQTDAAINPGNSGGPLLNLSGQVIGVNTAVSREGQLIGFAIPINDALRLIDNIEKYGRVIRPYLGVRYILLDPRIAKGNNLTVDYGALLLRGNSIEDLAVIPGGPADLAGLEENDIILEVNGDPINLNNSLIRVLADYGPGDTVTLTVFKDGAEVEISVELGEFDSEK